LAKSQDKRLNETSKCRRSFLFLFLSLSFSHFGSQSKERENGTFVTRVGGLC
jgi:hypothetical protein